MPMGKGTYGSQKGRPSKKKKGYYGGGLGIETTDNFQAPNFQMPGRIMGMAPKKTPKPKAVSGSKAYSQAPPMLPKMGRRDKFYGGGNLARPN